MIYKREIEQHHDSGFGGKLGRHVEHDERSKDYAWGIVAKQTNLHEVHHRHYGGPLDQDGVGSCTGEAVAQACNTDPLHLRGAKLKTQADAFTCYHTATQLDGFPGVWPPEDTGSSGLAAAKAGVKLGWITSYRHAFSVEEGLTALMQRSIITGVNWYEGFDRPDDHGFVDIAGQVRGGHEFEIQGFIPRVDFEESILIALNSWGLEWGLKGKFYFRVRTWRQLLAEEGDCTILIR